MNYALRVSRLIVCMYLGFASFFTMAAMDDDSATRKAILEKAWSCDPVLQEEMWWGFSVAHPSVTSFDEWLPELPKTLLKFQGCPDQDGNEEMRKAFIREYVEFGYEMNEYGSLKYVFQTYKNLRLEPRGMRPDRIRPSDSYRRDVPQEQEKKIQKVKQEKIAAENAAKNEAVRMRKASLISGAIRISSFDDAILVYGEKDIWGIMGSPLLTPDKEVYSGLILVDGQESDGVIRAKVMNIFSNSPMYATLRLGKKTVSYASGSLRIGGKLHVMGRYIQNATYITVGGEEKTKPVIDVMYLGD